MTPEAPTPRVVDRLRQVTDARALRALSHPVRVALLDELYVQGPLTATEAAERIGESPTTCSFHLRQLAKYGFVEEAGGGKGRARPWQVKDEGLNLSSDHRDPAAAVAVGAVRRLLYDAQLRRLENWRETRAGYPPEWREAAGQSEFVTWMTPDELTRLRDELLDLIYSRFHERRTDPGLRPDGALPVETLLFSYPITPPGGGG